MTNARHHRGSARLFRSEIGSAMVEFSLLAPFLLSLALGMFEFGRFIYQYQMVVEGLRDAGRYIARLDPTVLANQTSAANLATTGTIDGTGTARVTGWTADDIDFDVTDVDNDNGSGAPLYRGGDTIQVIEVTTTFNYSDLGFLDVLGLGELSVAASHEQRVIKE
jgi:Flp pilus assembly protein TadG